MTRNPGPPGSAVGSDGTPFRKNMPPIVTGETFSLVSSEFVEPSPAITVPADDPGQKYICPDEAGPSI